MTTETQLSNAIQNHQSGTEGECDNDLYVIRLTNTFNQVVGSELVNIVTGIKSGE
jgi:hypothetical protein